MSPNVGPSTQVLKKFHKLPIEIVTTVLYCCTLHGRELFPIHNGVNQQSCRAIWDNIYSLLRVCRFWNHVVMSTPQMWEFVMWSSTKPEANFEPVRIFLERSRNAFLDVNIELGPGPWQPLTKAVSMLLPHMHRVRLLRSEGPPSLQLLLFSGKGGLPALRQCYFQGYSSVHYSTFESLASPESTASLNDNPPNPLILTSFHINGCWAYSLFDRIDTRMIQELHLLGNWITPQAIQCLTQCTVLQTLDMTTRELRVPDPLALPSIRRLLIRGRTQDLGRFFSSLPLLEHLSVIDTRFLITQHEKFDSRFLENASSGGNDGGAASLVLRPSPTLPKLLSLTVDSTTSRETLEILYGTPLLKRLHLHGTADFSSILHFLALKESKAEDSELDSQVVTEKAHFRDLDLLRLWPAEGDSASPSASPEYHAQNEDVRGVVRLLTRLLKTRPALHVEIGFLNRRWLGGSFQELQSNFGDRIVLRYKLSEDCD